MNRFTAADLSSLQATQEAHMQDKCIVLTYGETADDYGNPTPYWVEGSEIYCGFEHRTPKEWQPSGDVPAFDARLRLALDTVIDPRDHVRITERYGEDLTATERYEIVGYPRRGPSGLYLDLKLVTNGLS